MKVKRVMSQGPGFATDRDRAGWARREDWPVHWIAADPTPTGSHASLFRLKFQLDQATTFGIHVTADQRYRLAVDGQWVARGSERGTRYAWYYETYELELPAGEHELAALTWWIRDKAPWAQDTAGPGFLLAADTGAMHEALATGVAPWQAVVLEGVEFLDPIKQMNQNLGCGARFELRGPAPVDVLGDSATKWGPVRSVGRGNGGFVQGMRLDDRVLCPGQLPPMREQPWSGGRIVHAESKSTSEGDWGAIESANHDADLAATFEAWLKGTPAAIPANTNCRAVVDLETYLCAYERLTASGGKGASVTVRWAERLSTEPDRNRAPEERRETEGRWMVGVADAFHPDGMPRAYEPLWWMAGRYVQLEIVTADKPLTLERFELRRTGYPLDRRARLDIGGELGRHIDDTALRTLEACSHETFMDCPFYEQLQYVGDTRLQVLLHYAIAGDDRLGRKAIDSFRQSVHGAAPFPASNHPSRSYQIIPPFALWWIHMVHDHAWWQGDRAFAAQQMPLARWIVHQFLSDMQDGLARSPNGWNYVDSSAYRGSGGEPSGGFPGEVSLVINLQLVLALNALAELEPWVGEPALGQWASEKAKAVWERIINVGWDAEQQCLADDFEHTVFSEHAQSLATLTGMLDADQASGVRRALAEADLITAGPYFTHYILCAHHQLGMDDALLDRIDQWKRYLDAGLYTFPEHHITGRSDCHAWSAHPTWHRLVHVLGIQPADIGFGAVRISPRPGRLAKLSGAMPHAMGMIEVDMDRDAGRASVTLPEGLSGVWEYGGDSEALGAGESVIAL